MIRLTFKPSQLTIDCIFNIFLLKNKILNINTLASNFNTKLIKH